MDTFLLTNLTKAISLKKNMVDSLMHTCNSYYEKPAHTLQELKIRNQKVKGDIFEQFCKLYMKTCYGLKDVWLLNEIPNDKRELLNLHKRDYGIDLVGIDNDNNFYAIQAKFRKRTCRTTRVTWKQLSTFYALCERTGPFKKFVVFTTADYANRMGKKSDKDVTIGYKKLQKITHFEWLEMIKPLPLEQNKTLPIEELRKKRFAFFHNNNVSD